MSTKKKSSTVVKRKSNRVIVSISFDVDIYEKLMKFVPLGATVGTWLKAQVVMMVKSTKPKKQLTNVR